MTALLDILWEGIHYWVSRHRKRGKVYYDVNQKGFTHSTAIERCDIESIAIARAKYLDTYRVPKSES